ncbi:MAG: phage holin family protein [Gammaproteobacteria bacterium]
MPPGDRSIAVVLQDIVSNIQDIVRSEVRLARTEVGEELAKARSAGVLVGVGVVAAVFSALFLLLAAVYALSRVMPEWAAALIVAIGIAIVAGVALAVGIKQFKTVQPAPKTAASLKENVEWAKQLTR